MYIPFFTSVLMFLLERQTTTHTCTTKRGVRLKEISLINQGSTEAVIILWRLFYLTDQQQETKITGVTYMYVT